MKRVVASFFGAGLVLGRVRSSDLGSGTLASLPALALALALHRLGWELQAVGALAAVTASVWSSAPFTREDPGSRPGVLPTKEGDPGWVVIDEVAGTLVATVGLGGLPAVVAWAVFRLADVVKRAFPGVGQAERMPGGWGVTADDVVAGLYGLAAGWLVVWMR